VATVMNFETSAALPLQEGRLDLEIWPAFGSYHQTSQSAAEASATAMAPDGSGATAESARNRRLWAPSGVNPFAKSRATTLVGPNAPARFGDTFTRWPV